MVLLTVPIMLRRRYIISRRINANHALEPIMVTKGCLMQFLTAFQIDSIFSCQINATFDEAFAQVKGLLTKQHRQRTKLDLFCRVLLTEVTTLIVEKQQYRGLYSKFWTFSTIQRLFQRNNNERALISFIFFTSTGIFVLPPFSPP